jgi:hypothetical protein
VKRGASKRPFMTLSRGMGPKRKFPLAGPCRPSDLDRFRSFAMSSADRMRLIVDTNGFVSAALKQNSRPARSLSGRDPRARGRRVSLARLPHRPSKYLPRGVDELGPEIARFLIT